jgi:Skp family chaperone for outer membrane proteins
MRKILLSLFVCFALICANQAATAQGFKVGVFDIGLMVQALPDYSKVDSLMQIYERDSLGAEYQYYQLEFARLDSIVRVDSAAVAQNKLTKGIYDRFVEDKRKMGLNLVYWQQIAQNKSNAKRNQYAQPLIAVVSSAYKKVLDRKKYTLVLKPETYEAGFAIDNIFIAVARELKMQSLPQELLFLGDDPDAPKTPAKPGTTTKPPAKPAGSK